MKLSKTRIEISLDEITLSERQARQRDTTVDKNDDLVHSIKRDGLINPVVVKKLSNGKYDLISGQRRYYAHAILHRNVIDAYVVDGDVDELEAKRISLVENAARKDMKRADYVDTIQMFMDKYNSTTTVAEEVGLSVPTVRKYLTIGRLPKNIREAVTSGSVTAANAIKALDTLGGDETTVDQSVLLETAQIMQGLTPAERDRFAHIKKNEPNMPLDRAVKKTKRERAVNQFTIEITDDLLSKIDKFKDRVEIRKTEDAAIELISIGLGAAEV